MDTPTEKSGGSAGTLSALGRELARCKRDLDASTALAARLAQENDTLREDFRDLFEEAPIAYVHEGLDSRFIRANRAAMRVLGIRPDEVASTFGRSLVARTPETLQRLHEAFEAVGLGKETGDVELELRRKDNGEPVWVQWWSRPASNGDFTRTMMVDITDRVRMAQTKAALEFSLESGQVGDWDLDLVNDTSRRSLRHDQCFGYGAPITNWGVKQFIGHVHPDDRSHVESGFRQAVGGLQDWSSEFRVIWPDGSLHWLAARGRVYQVSEGKATRMLGVVMDITERKSAEEKLRETKAALEFTLESAGVGDWDLDLINDTSTRSLRHDQCFGYDTPIPEAEWGIEVFIRHVHPQDRARVETSLRGAVGDLLGWQSEFRVVWPDQSVHWIAARGSIYRTREGKATRMLGIVIDITERKKAEIAHARLFTELQEWEARFRLAIDTIPGLTWFCLPDGSAEFLNTQWCAYTGLAMQDALGWDWVKAIHPDDLPGLSEHWRRTVQSTQAAEHEARVRRFDGEYRWFLFRCQPLLDDAGKVVRWYGTNTDIEERKRAEQAVRASEQVSRGQIDALKSTLDALAMEPAANRLVEHVLRIIADQFGAHSVSVWRRDPASGKIRFELAYEDSRVITKADPPFVELDQSLPMEGLWPWPDVFSTGKPSLIEDIRTVPPFALRDRLLPLGIVTVLLVPMFVAGRLEGAVGLRFVEKQAFRSEEIDLAQALANQAMLMIQFARLSTQSRETAVIAERNRIARDIHDTLAQGFTGVIVQLEAAEDANLQGFPKEAGQHLDRARSLARESLNEARRSVQALRPQALDDSDLSDALDDLFRKMTAGTGLVSEFTVLGVSRSLRPEWETNLFHIGQEILTNALRHARAMRFTATLAFLPGEVSLDLRDDGRGFDPSLRNDGYGLLGIRERVEGMGGRLVVQSLVGQGTTVLITLPLSEA